jgi:predicted nucleotidyltransferase
MSIPTLQKWMVGKVAEALGPDLREQVAFVGGCTTSFLLTDEFVLEQVRHTDDVDLIVHVMGYPGFHKLQQALRAKGFKDMPPDPEESAPVCAMKLGDLRVDFMPDDPQVLGFSNRWYGDALKTAMPYELSDDLSIRLVNPPYFLATKLEAYKGRGKGDTLSSHDIEDLLTLIDGRESLIDEVRTAPEELRGYLAEEFSQLLQDTNFEYAVNSQAGGNVEREQILFERIETLAQCGD